jgi:hypothetical protein
MEPDVGCDSFPLRGNAGGRLICKDAALWLGFPLRGNAGGPPALQYTSHLTLPRLLVYI